MSERQVKEITDNYVVFNIDGNDVAYPLARQELIDDFKDDVSQEIINGESDQYFKDLGAKECETCISCGRPLDTNDKKWLSGWCSNCRTSPDGMLKIFVLINSLISEPRSWRDDREDRERRARLIEGCDIISQYYPEWSKISEYICRMFNVNFVSSEIFARFMTWFCVSFDVDENGFLRLERSGVANILDRLESRDDKRVNELDKYAVKYRLMNIEERTGLMKPPGDVELKQLT